jgi:hypothetical protein
MRPHLIPAQESNQPAISGHRRKVDFIIAGAQKGGTTALDAYLRTHPEIGMADIKEVHFFDEEKYFLKTQPPYSIYHRHFSHAAARKIWGEATPIYMYWLKAPQRIHQYNPRMKLLMVLRNPIERAYSHWNMERDRSADNFSFWAAIQNEKERCREALPLQHRVYSYVDRGFYTEQLERIWKFFPRTQTLVLKNESLRNHPLQTMNEICDFLGVERFEKVEHKEAHSRQYLAPMGAPEKKLLKRIFKPEIRKLEQLLNWDCSDWLPRNMMLNKFFQVQTMMKKKIGKMQKMSGGLPGMLRR